MLAGLAAGLLALGGAQTAQAQTAHVGQGVALVFSGGDEPEGVVIDAAGNVYTGSFGGGLYKATYHNGTYTNALAVSTGETYDLAIDSSGNIYVAETGNGQIVKVVPNANGTYTTSVIISGFPAVGVAVDAYGNIFTSNDSGGALYKYINSGGTYTQHTIATGFGAFMRSVSVDTNGNVFQSDTNNNLVKQYAPSGSPQTTTTYTYVGTVGTGLNAPAGVTAKNGIVYISDGGNARLLQETPNGSGGYTQTVLMNSTYLNMPRGIAPDPSGNIFVGDYQVQKLWRLTNALPDFGSVSVGATSAQQSISFVIDTAGILGTPAVLTKGTAGLDFALGTDSTCIGAVTAGEACIVNVTFKPQYPGLRQGAVELTNSTGGVIATAFIQGTGSGPAASYTPGTISTVAGNGTACASPTAACGDGSAATAANLKNPAATALDAAGNLYIADQFDNRVRKVAASTGNVTTVAGNGTAGYSGDNGAATSAELSSPYAVAVDGAGNLYIADQLNNRVRKVTIASGIITTVAGNGAPNYSGDSGLATSAALNEPSGVAVDGAGNLYISDTGDGHIRKVAAATGIITTVAGGGSALGDNGPAVSALLSTPGGIALDGAGNLYIADTEHDRIRKVTAATGIITTVAGNGSSGYDGDGGSAVSAELNLPSDVSTDAAGNLYIADTGNNVIRNVTAATGMISTVAGVSGGGSYSGDNAAATTAHLSIPTAVSLDGLGNLYIADQSNNRIRKVTATPAPFAFANTYVFSSSADSPQTETLLNIGTTALTFEVPAAGGNPSISTGFTIGNSSTCPQLTTSSSAGTLASGESCTDLISFDPQVVGTFDGSLITMDNALNVANSTQTVALTGTSLPQLTKTITFPQPATPVTVDSTATLTATTSSGDPVTYTVTAGTATISGAQITYTNDGSVTITANSGATSEYSAAAPVSQTVVVNSDPTSYLAPTTNVGVSSATLTAYVNFTAGGTLGAINVLTKGAPGLDFQFAAGGTCTVGVAYTAGQACSVNYTFKPLSAGSRFGAVVLTLANGSVLGTSYLSGTGVGPLAVFTTTSQSWDIPALATPRGLSADGYGNSYVLETGNGKFDKIAAGTHALQTITTIANTGSGGTTVDGAGNLFVAATGARAIYEYVGGLLPAVAIVTNDCGNDDNIEVDGAGNLYFTCYTSNQGAIYEVNAVTHALTQLLPGGLGHRFVAMTVDTAGNVYAADFNENVLYKLPAGTSGAGSLVTLVSGGALDNPHGIALDPAGNIYVTNYVGPNNVLRYAAGTYALTKLPAAGSRGVVLDGSGNLYTIPDDTDVAEYSRTSAPTSITFANTGVGTTSNSIQSVELENDGNAPLAISSYQATGMFSLGGPLNTCAVGTLGSGAACQIGAIFSPTAVGPQTGTAEVTDNTQNAAGTVQTAPLSGLAIQGPQTINFTPPTSPVAYGVSPITLSATGGGSGNAVTFSLVSGPATVSGNVVAITGAGSVVVAANQAGDTNYLAAPQVTQTITVNQAALTAIIIGNPTKPYDSTTNATLTSANYQLSGLIGSDNIAVTQPVGSYSTANAGTSTVTATLTAANFQAVSGSLTNYTLPATASGAGTINTALASVAPAANGKTYGTTDPPLTGTLGGFFASDNVTATYTRNAGESVLGSPYTISATLSPAAALSNYTITYSTAPFTIVPAPVLITLSNLSQNYSGLAEPVTVATLPSGVAILSSYTGINGTVYGPLADPPTNPGSYSVVVTVIDPNYVGQQSGTLSINQLDPALNLTLMAGMPATTPYGTTVYFALGMASAPQCPTGSVQFYVDGAASGAPVALGGVSCSQPVPFQIATLTPGAHSLYAVYSGDNYFIGETSATLSYTVIADATSVTLAASASTVNVGQPLTLTATVTPASPGNALPPAGTVVFYDGSTPIGTGSVLTTTAPYTSVLIVPTLSAGSHSLTAAFVDTDGNYVGSSSPLATETVILNVPTINWTPSPTEFVYGTALGSGQLNATAVDASNNPVSGSFVYNFVTGTVLPVGTVNLTATFTPSDPSTYAGNSATITITVDPAPLSVTADSVSRIYGRSNPTFTYQIAGFVNSDPSSVVSGEASCTTTATTSSPVTTYPITCTQGSLTASNYSFQFVDGTLTVTQATPSLTWATPAAITYGTSLSAAQLDASANVAGTFAYTPASGVLTAGSQTLSVIFTPTDTTDYTTATASVNLTVNQATPTITWATPAAITYGTALSSAQLDASSTVAGTFAYTPASGVLTAGSHTLAVTFTPTDATDYTTATASVNLTVNQATPTITWATPAAITYGTALSGAQLDASANVAGTFAYTPASGVLTAGSQTLSVTFTPTDTTDYTTATASVNLTVNQATPSITWATPAAITYGTALSGAQLDATASVAGTFAYTPASGVLTAGGHTLLATFTPTDTTDYTTATASVNLTVNQATPSITWATPAAITYGTALSSAQLNATASVAGTFSYSPAAGVLTAGSHLLSVTFKPTDTADYTVANAVVSLAVAPAALTVTANNTSQVYGATPVLTATVTGYVNGDNSSASSGAPVLATVANSASLPGTYPITISLGTLAASNYTFNLVGGIDTVTFTASVPGTNGICNGTYYGTYKGNLKVTAGEVCIFINGGVTGNLQQSGGLVELITSKVGGNFQVNGGGSFSVTDGSLIEGNLQIQQIPAGPGTSQVCGSTVNGDLQFQNNGTAVIIGAAAPSACTGNTVGGNLQVQNNSAAASVIGNSVGNNLTVQNNTAATVVDNNKVNNNLQDQNNTASTQVFNDVVGGNLLCQANTSISGGGDSAKSKQQQCSAF